MPARLNLVIPPCVPAGITDPGYSFIAFVQKNNRDAFVRRQPLAFCQPLIPVVPLWIRWLMANWSLAQLRRGTCELFREFPSPPGFAILRRGRPSH